MIDEKNIQGGRDIFNALHNRQPKKSLSFKLKSSELHISGSKLLSYSYEILMPKKALFLDRDGVINEDYGYVHSRKNFQFIEGIFDLVSYASIRGYEVVVVTNQAGIAYGYYSERDFHELTSWMNDIFLSKKAPISKVFYCPNHPDGIGQYRKIDSNRKPGPGMLLNATDELDLELSASILVGDKITDILAGHAAGVQRNILFKTSCDDILYETTVPYSEVSTLSQVKNYLD